MAKTMYGSVGEPGPRAMKDVLGEESLNDSSQIYDGPTQVESQIQNAENDDGPESEEHKTFSFFKAPRQKKIILILCLLANFLSSCAFSLLRPFFPIVAEQKGMSLTMVGFVVGAYQLVVFLTSPVIGQLTGRIGIKFLYIGGIFIGGCCEILFGVLGTSPDGDIFLTMCILVRCVEAFGFSAFMTASLTIVSCEFEEYVGSVIALLRSANALGNMLGPLIGGALYDLGGYGLPFYALAIPILLNAAFVYYVLPQMESEKVRPKQKKNICGLFRSPLIIFALISMFVGVCGLNVYASTYALYLEPFDVSSTIAGAIYVINPLLYTLIAPLWAYITDVKKKSSALIVGGHLVQTFAWFVISGPSIILPFVTYSIPSILTGSGISGLSVGCLMIPIMKCLVEGAEEVGFQKCPETYAMVSGLFASTYALAGFVGPFVGGILVEQYGFPDVFQGLGLANFGLCIFTFIFYLFRHLRRRRSDQLVHQ